MRTLKFVTTTLALASAVAGPVAAQDMKPGLWEVTNEMGGEVGAQMAAAQKQMQQQLASMPPEQRKQMEKMFAQQGIKMGAGGGMSARTCITPEMAALNQAPVQQQGNCTQEFMPRKGKSMRFTIVCANPSGKGEGEITFHSPVSYSMKMKFAEQGTSQNMTMDARGKWLSSNCGNVKPRRQ